MAALTVDKFIEHSQQLISARPETTRVSTTYSRKLTRHKKNKVSKDTTTSSTTSNTSTPNNTNAKEPTHTSKISVKTYDPVSGTCFRVTLTRVNELGRVLSALGPIGITSTFTKQQQIRDSKSEKNSTDTTGSAQKQEEAEGKERRAKTLQVTYEKSVQGLASAMLGQKDTSKTVQVQQVVETEGSNKETSNGDGDVEMEKEEVKEEPQEVGKPKNGGKKNKKR